MDDIQKENERLASEILSDATFIANIYTIIKDAGIIAAYQLENTPQRNKSCVLMPNEPGVNRSTPCANTTKFSIQYDANSLTIVGGAALNLYDYKLKDLKTRRALRELQEYIKKKTSDIDINWWPKPLYNNKSDMIPISTSPAIIELVDNFVRELQASFDRHRDYLLRAILPHIKGGNAKDTLQIYVNKRHTRMAGVFNISIIFVIKDRSLKICDINVHDGGSGQLYDREGSIIADLRPMTEDPTYCEPLPGKARSVMYLRIQDTDVAVPNLVSLVDQQLFAFDNLVRNPKEAATQKALVAARRMEFIKQTLLSFQLHDPNNRANYKELFEVFGTNNKEIVPHMIQQIDHLRGTSMQRIKNELLPPLQRLHQTIHMEWRRGGGTIPIKKEFIKVGKQVEEVIAEIEEETDLQLLAAYKTTKAASDLQGFTSKLEDIATRRNERQRRMNEERRAAHTPS